MGLESNLLLIGDGVYNALKNSQGYKADTMKAYMGDEGEVKVHQKSLEERGLSEGDLMEGVQVINDDEVASLMESFEAFSTF
jgi:tRNA 2-thiouridine synthesizing protein C